MSELFVDCKERSKSKPKPIAKIIKKKKMNNKGKNPWILNELQWKKEAYLWDRIVLLIWTNIKIKVIPR